MYLGLGQPFSGGSEFVRSSFGCRAVVGRQGAVWAAIGQDWSCGGSGCSRRVFEHLLNGSAGRTPKARHDADARIAARTISKIGREAEPEPTKGKWPY